MLSFWLNTGTALGQSEEARKWMREADNFFKVREYLNAIELYEKALAIEPEDIRANFQVALSYLRSLDKVKALAPLQKVQSMNPNHSPLLEFYLAEAFKYRNLPDEATYYYEFTREKFTGRNGKITIYNDEISIPDFLELIAQRLREAKFGTRFLADPTNARVRNIGEVINSEYGDYAPVITADESMLIFTSRRKGTTGGGKAVTDGLYYEDIYKSEMKNGEWTKPKGIDGNVNSKYHEASIALSPDGNQLFVYQDDSGGDIYFSERNGKTNWSIPRKVGGKINSRYREPSVSVTEDGQTLYFSSDRPGGLGGLDIYRVSKKKNGEWGEPENLGPTINTAEDDDAPFIHFDTKTLYFSSRGHQTMGGFDIFYSELIDGQWTEPVNLGYPINTAEDDIHFVLSADYKRGYYASAKPDGYGDKDIYVVDMPDYRDVEVIDFQLSLKTIAVGFNPLTTRDPERAIVILRGVVKDEQSDELISARMTLIDVEENEVVEEIDAVAPKGKYYTKMKTGRRYLLHVQKEGYLYHSEYFEIPVGVINQEKILHIYLKRITPQKSIDFKALFDYNSATLKKISLAALEKLLAFLQTNPNIKGEIEGHTDNIGTEERNQSLSEERARSVYQYLIDNGIAEDRISFVGYGESRPIATNDTAHGRSLNRRTEFKILEIEN
ncbi:MAG: hypothetical protein OHK0053_15850 [Microscillaceae bacterium]